MRTTSLDASRFTGCPLVQRARDGFELSDDLILGLDKSMEEAGTELL